MPNATLFKGMYKLFRKECKQSEPVSGNKSDDAAVPPKQKEYYITTGKSITRNMTSP